MYIKQNVEKILFLFGKPYHLLEHNPDVIFSSFIFSVKRFVLFLKNKIIIILSISFCK